MNLSKSHNIQLKKGICQEIMDFILDTPRHLSVPGITNMLFEADNMFSKLTQVGVKVLSHPAPLHQDTL